MPGEGRGGARDAEGIGGPSIVLVLTPNLGYSFGVASEPRKGVKRGGVWCNWQHG